MSAIVDFLSFEFWIADHWCLFTHAHFYRAACNADAV